MSDRAIMVRAARVALCGIRFGLAASSLPSADRRAAEIYLLVTACGVSQPLAATVCGCTKQNVSKLLQRVEDRRDDPHFDAALAALETALGGEG